MYEKFVTQIKAAMKNEINKIHTAMPGEIVDVDTETGYCTVKPKGQFHISGNVEKVLDFPTVSDVPIVFPYSKTAEAEIIVPVKAGDDCLIIFSEQALDYWLGTGTQNSSLKHSLSNAICIPGLMKEISDGVREANENDAVVIRKNTSSITLSDAGICVTGDVTVNGNITLNGKINAAESVSEGSDDGD